jgi:GNAT superfamily N-acetyltransferase
VISIEIASEADIDELTRVEIESKLQSYPEHMEEVSIDPAIRLYRWQAYFRGERPATSKPERIVFKAVKAGRIVGFIAGHLTNRHKDAEIENFYVLKDEQGKGIGTQLLKKLLPWFISHNAKSLCAGIFPQNPYQAFYLKHHSKYLNPHWVYWDDLPLLESKLFPIN